ncbi:hypothetical protein BTW07_01735 [Salinicola socius]|uniref:GCVT N-terminal domain-containing protein n=1 Tax=Salinicola socius TaxID=404433 RepID=A0A1Q8SW77_9GAMM|nr:hypothetical protein BTW07_01735 [Salinicola socius]
MRVPCICATLYLTAGSHSRELLAQLVWNAETQTAVKQWNWFHFMVGRLGGPDGMPLMVSRTGYTGELGFEVWCHPDHAERFWDAIWEAGQQYGLAPIGLDALDMLRIEAGLIFAGHEFCPETNPFEAGIGFTVPLKSKEEDFVGREALARQTPESRHKLMGLVIDSTERVEHGDQVLQGRFPAGVVTSATQSRCSSNRSRCADWLPISLPRDTGWRSANSTGTSNVWWQKW